MFNILFLSLKRDLKLGKMFLYLILKAHFDLKIVKF